MHCRAFDRSPIVDLGVWDQTPAAWREQGYPQGANFQRYFGLDSPWTFFPSNPGLSPAFEFEVLQEDVATEVVRDRSGVTLRRGKYLGSLPSRLAYTLVDRESWRREFLPRLDPAHPGRYPDNWRRLLGELIDPGRKYPLGIEAGSLYGALREWMGIENLSLLIRDDPGLFEEMVEALAQCSIGSIVPALESGLSFEFAAIRENLCYRGGPLLAPKVFRDVLVPRYRAIASCLRSHGCDVVIVDCDGDIRPLIPLWLDAGVNGLFPVETGSWNTDPAALRREFGDSLLMIGGVGESVLTGTRAQITAEVERLAPVAAAGGYIPAPDHSIPPHVPFDNYMHYIREARRVWGRGHSSLEPIEVLDPFDRFIPIRT